MMIVPIKSIGEFVSEINKLHSNWSSISGDIWYRGIHNKSCSLIPGILWRGIDDEDSLVDEFLIHYRAIIDQHFTDAWELYALMQHYRLPTRLLDWTRSPLIALYFALEKIRENGKPAVVWAMDPYKFNKRNHNTDSVFSPMEKFRISEGIPIENYLPKALREGTENSPAKPLAVELQYANRRIHFQQGCFTIHGTEIKTIDSYIRRGTANAIMCFEIRTNKVRKELREALWNLGYREDYVYQDLDHLSERIIRERV